MKDLKQKVKNLEPVIRIGKNGVNDNVNKEIDKLLRNRKLIKIKILNNCPIDKEKVIEDIIIKSKSTLVSKIGNVFSIYKK